MQERLPQKIEIGGDTTKLQTALKWVNTEIRNTQTVGNKISSAGQKLLPVTGVVTGLGTAVVKTTADSSNANTNVSMMDGVAWIPVAFSVTAKWLKKLAEYAKKDKISVQYFDVETAELKLAEMYVTGYKAKLKKDTSYKGLWTVSFTLKEM